MLTNLDDRVTHCACVGSTHTHTDLFAASPLMQVKQILGCDLIARGGEELAKQRSTRPRDESIAEAR
jgi:hypothetical protein